MSDTPETKVPTPPETPTPDAVPAASPKKIGPKEIGGGKGPEPTRYGDWEVGGICSDF